MKDCKICKHAMAFKFSIPLGEIVYGGRTPSLCIYQCVYCKNIEAERK